MRIIISMDKKNHAASSEDLRKQVLVTNLPSVIRCYDAISIRRIGVRPAIGRFNKPFKEKLLSHKNRCVVEQI